MATFFQLVDAFLSGGDICKSSKARPAQAERALAVFLSVVVCYFVDLIFACAAARRAIGTLYGEQDT